MARADRGSARIEMNIKTKNILTAVALVAVALTIYVFAVMKAMSQ